MLCLLTLACCCLLQLAACGSGGGEVVFPEPVTGSIGQGALETGAGHTTFLGVAGEKHLSGSAQVGCRADIGFSALTGKTSGLVQGAANLVSTRFEVDFLWQGWALRLAQTIYFENGALDLRLPTKRIADGGVAFRDQSVAVSQNRSANMHVEKTMIWAVLLCTCAVMRV